MLSLRDEQPTGDFTPDPSGDLREEWRELNHRVANSLRLAASFLDHRKRKIADPQARQALAAASARLDAVGRLHRFLYLGDGASQVDLRAFLGDLCPGIAASTGLGCSVEVEPMQVPADMAQHIGIAVNELAINAGKHAYAEGEAGEIRIRCFRARDHLVLTVADGGKGLPDGFDPGQAPGLGMRVVLATARQFGGSLKVENDGGARFILKLPLPRPQAAA